MQLGKSQKTNQFLESLKAEGEVILEDVQPKASQSRSAAPPLTDPITLTVEEKLNVTLKQDGGVSNFDVQGTLSLQILNQEDGLIQVQVLCVCVCVCLCMPGFVILVVCYYNIIVFSDINLSMKLPQMIKSRNNHLVIGNWGLLLVCILDTILSSS